MAALMLLSACFGGNSPKDLVSAAEHIKSVAVRFHYLRTDSDYTDWSLWLWEDEQAGTDNAFTGVDEDGAYYELKADTRTSAVGYIVRTPNWDKDTPNDRSVDISGIVSGTVDVYLTSGVEEARIEEGDDVQKGAKAKSVVYDGNQSIAVSMTVEIADASGFQVYSAQGEEQAVSEVSGSGPEYEILLSEKLNGLGSYYVLYHDVEYKVNMPILYSTEEFEENYTYAGDDLGANWSQEKTEFRLWAPTAEAASVRLYQSGDASVSDLIGEYPMTAGEKGVWSASVEGNQNGVYYTYQVTVDNQTVETTDPYAKAAGVNGDRAMVIDLTSTDPEGWENDKNPKEGDDITDAVIYELSVRDFSSDESSGVSEGNRGKYPAFTEHGTTSKTGAVTGIDYLKELGVTHVQLLPIQDFSGVDEKKNDSYNWGYATKNYNVPEGSYSTDPYDGAVRIRETKEMIQSLHENGMGVIMDVVYNHVFDAPEYCFNKLVPGYFTRIAEDGTYSNGSYCGNDTASERSMVKKYIVDSVVYWAEEYHVDGFRFDLAGVLDTETVNEIVKEVRAVDPSILLYGEGWSMPTVSTKQGTLFATQTNAALTPGFGYFDDRIRNRVKGQANDSSLGFITSGQYASQLEGNLLARLDWTSEPTQIINYVSCHDDMTLWDKINTVNAGTREQKIQQNKLASAVVLGAQGTPFIHAGEELLRTKVDESGNVIANSYQASDYVNSIKWSGLDDEEVQAVSRYYQGMIDFRNAHKALRMTSSAAIAENASILSGTPENVVAYVIDGTKVEGETAAKLLIAYNPNQEAVSLELPAGDWSVCVDGQNAGTDVIGTVSGTLQMDGISAYMLVQDTAVEGAELPKVTVYYKSANEKDCMLYGLFGAAFSEGGAWSVIDAMEPSSYEGYKKAVIDAGRAESVQVCFNDGMDHWDNNNGNNYSLGVSGSYVVEDGTVYAGVPTEKTDLTELNALISAAEALQEEEYTKESFSALKTALETAKALGTANTQKEIDAAAAALKTAMDKLEKKAAEPGTTDSEKPEETEKPGGSGTGSGTADAEKPAGSGTADAGKPTEKPDGKVTEIVLDRTSVTLAVGEKCTVQAKALPEDAADRKILWSTSNRSVAAVKNGTIQAVEPGKAVVTATAADGSGKKAEIVVKVRPKKVSNVKKSGTGTTDLKLTWSAQSGASGYVVKLYQGKKLVKEVSTASASYTFKKLKKVTSYTVKVCAYKNIDGTRVEGSSTSLKTATSPAKVKISGLKNSSSRTASLKWKKVKGATGYEIYAKKGTGSYKKMKTITSKTTVQLKLSKNTKYTFKVRAYKTVNGKKVYGDFSGTKSITVK